MDFFLDIPVTFTGGFTHSYDLIVPDGQKGSIPLLIWIHGGGWCGGEKRVFNDFERFVFHGCAVLSIDYRLSGEAPYPAALEDCEYALKWAEEHAALYGYSADKLIVGGSSAGGHLAALLALKKAAAGDMRIRAAVDLFGPADLCELPELRHEIDAFTSGDPGLARDASPLYNVCAGAPDFLIVHGTADSCVPVLQSRRLRDALIAAGNNVTYLEIPGGGHGFDTPEYHRTLTDFIQSHI